MKASKQGTHENEASEESDSETIEQSSYSYEHLINEIKIKSTALTKASNLIEILQVELEVQKNSKEEAVRAAEQQLRQKYQIEIASLQEQIRNLDQGRKAPVVHSTQLRRQDSRILPRSNSRTLNRSRSRDGSVCCSNMGKEGKGKNVQSELSLEVKIYRKWILQTLSCDTNLMEIFEQLIDQQNQQIQNYLYSAEDQSSELMEILRNQSQLGKKAGMLNNRIKELEKIIRTQNDLISNMKIYQTNLEETISVVNKKLTQYSQENYVNPIKSMHIPSFEVSIEEVINKASKLKMENLAQSTKLDKVQVQNGQLRNIIEEMISLMKRKRFMTDYT